MTDGERLRLIYAALQKRGYAPIDQIVGFLLSGDPTCITDYNSARSMAGQINRAELLTEVVAGHIKRNDLDCVDRFKAAPAGAPPLLIRRVRTGAFM